MIQFHIAYTRDQYDAAAQLAQNIIDDRDHTDKELEVARLINTLPAPPTDTLAGLTRSELEEAVGVAVVFESDSGHHKEGWFAGFDREGDPYCIAPGRFGELSSHYPEVWDVTLVPARPRLVIPGRGVGEARPASLETAEEFSDAPAGTVAVMRDPDGHVTTVMLRNLAAWTVDHSNLAYDAEQMAERFRGAEVIQWGK